MNQVLLFAILCSAFCYNSYGEQLEVDGDRDLLVRNFASNHLRRHRIVAFTASLSRHIRLGTHQAVVYNEVLLNRGNAYNVHHGHFTAPVRGIYLMSASVLAKPYKQVALDMVSNGFRIAVFHADARSSRHYSSQSRSFPVYLNRGQQVWMRTHPGFEGQVLQGDSRALYQSFTGVLLNPF